MDKVRFALLKARCFQIFSLENRLRKKDVNHDVAIAAKHLANTPAHVFVEIERQSYETMWAMENVECVLKSFKKFCFLFYQN